MQKSFSKIKWFFACILVTVIVITAGINGTLLALKKDFINHIHSTYGLNLNYRFLLYIPPNKFLIKDVTETGVAGRSSGTLLVPFILIRTSLKEAFENKSITFSNAFVTFSGVNESALYFLKHNHKRIRGILEALPKNDITFFIDGMRLTLSENKVMENDFVFTARGSAVSGKGRVMIKKIDSPGLLSGLPKHRPKRPTDYSFKFIYSDKTMLIDYIKIAGPQIQVKIWGNMVNNQMGINGFALFKTVPEPEQSVGVFNLFTDYFNRRKATGINNPTIYLTDLYGLAHVQWPKINVENIDFVMNNMPVNVTGYINAYTPFKLQLDGVVYPGKSRKNEPAHFNQARLQISSIFKEGSLMTSGNFVFETVKRQDMDNAVEEISLAFSDLGVWIKKYSRYLFNLKNFSLAVKTGKEIHRVAFDKLEGTMNNMDKDVKYAELKAPFYGGRLEGKAWLDSRTFPIEITSAIKLKDINPNKIEIFKDHFSKVYGSMNSEVYFYNHPDFHIQGEMNIKKGKLNDYEFFKWLAETFDLRSLRDVDFKELSADFIVNLNEAALEDIQLESDKININGYYQLDKNNLVKSKISLYFNRDVLEESRKFRPIINMFDREKKHFNFDFQLSGNQSAMNFQWLDSDIKQRIQQRIPDFIERGIEHNVGEMLEPGEKPPAATSNYN